MSRQILAYDDIVSPPKPTLSLPSESTKSAARSLTDAAQLQAHKAGAAASTPSSKQDDLKRKRTGDDNDISTSTQEVSRPTARGASLDLGEDTPVGGAPVPSTAHTTSFSNIPKPPHKKNRARRQRERGRGGASGAPNYNAGGAAGSFNDANSSNGRFGAAVHWDDPGTENMDINYDGDGIEDELSLRESNAWDENGAQIGGEDEDDEDESRDLTHEEIWDDSALIEAWDAAIEEYEAVHGKNKDWKKARKHKSPLWYNVPPAKPSGSAKLKEKSKELRMNAEEPTDGSSSVPLNFDTFVPTHDASLSVQPAQPPPVPDATASQYNGIAAQYTSTLPGPEQDLSMVTPDEAFNRAIGAMYWCGYWTAVYHVQRSHEEKGASLDVNGEEAADECEEGETEELVSTQR